MNAVRQMKTYPRFNRFISLPANTATQVDQNVENLTQDEQDRTDDEYRREAMRDLVESWMDRLQLISVITTFFASTEASMISITAPSSDGTPLSITAQLANIGLMGALVVHSNAAIISFLAAFYLIRYKLKVAKVEQAQFESKPQEIVDSPISMTFHNSTMGRAQGVNMTGTPRDHTVNSEHQTDPIPGLLRIISPLNPRRPVYSRNPHIVQVGPFQGKPPTHLLARFHALCIILTALGFSLALMGILCFAWDRLPLSVSISSSFFMAMCLLAGLYIWLKPDPEEGTSPHIYYTGS